MAKNTNITIFIDLDGVSVNLHKELRQLLSLPKYLKKVTWMCEYLGCKKSEFWSLVYTKYQEKIDESNYDRAAVDFWSNLNEINGFNLSLYNKLRKNNEVYFLSRPVSGDPYCIAGKTLWLEKRFGPKFKDVIFTAHKNLLANYERILIDDDLKNCKKFLDTGGKCAILFKNWEETIKELKEMQII